MLKATFVSLVSKYTDNQNDIRILWESIEKKYSDKNRHYHNLTHLENLYEQLCEIKKEIKDWEMILFALFYHDYIYNPLKNNNEEKSAEKCIKTLQALDIETARIKLCNQTIIATKSHQVSESSDINYFTDADLSILGVNWETYELYFKNVRKEYRFYPDFVYNKGRISVLKSFLEMSRIYKTEHFHHQYEKQATENLLRELDILLKS